jgi:hypothetical protein
MTEDELAHATPAGAANGRKLPDHPIRLALLDLIAEEGTVTATRAAARLGHSSGLCSFHLRQLARHGLIEESPHAPGRGGPRPWRLRWEDGGAAGTAAPDGFTALGHDLEDAAYRRRLAEPDRAPAGWRQDESFSTVVHLTPREAAEVAAAVREALAPYARRTAHPADAVPAVVVARLFPLPPAAEEG